MNVKELKKLLEKYDDDAIVVLEKDIDQDVSTKEVNYIEGKTMIKDENFYHDNIDSFRDFYKYWNGEGLSNKKLKYKEYKLKTVKTIKLDWD